MARVYMTQARTANHPEFRSTLVRWARKRFHQYLRGEGAGQMDIFGNWQYDLNP
jgi:hypothetical protein